MRPSAGDSTAFDSGGITRGGSRKNCTMKAAMNHSGAAHHAPANQCVAAAAMAARAMNGQPSRAMIGCGYALTPGSAAARVFDSSPITRHLVLGLVHQPVLLDPRHHVAQLGADRLDRVRLADAAHCLQRGRARPVLQNEFPRELPGLDLLQDLFHLRARLLVDYAGPPREIAV